MTRIAALGLALVALSACASVPSVAPPPAVPLSPEDPRPRAFLDAVRERAEARHALRGRARIAVDARDGEVQLRGNQVLVVERPSRLRVEILGFLGQTVAVLVTDGERFEFARADDRSYESGPLYPGLLWEVAYIALEPDEVVALVLGAPRSPRVRLAVVSAEETPAGDVRVALADRADRVRRRLTFDAQGRLRALQELAPDGGVRSDARFGAYEDVAGSPFAHAISFRTGDGTARAELSLRDVELNPELPEGIFRIAPPESARRAP